MQTIFTCWFRFITLDNKGFLGKRTQPKPMKFLLVKLNSWLINEFILGFLSIDCLLFCHFFQYSHTFIRNFYNLNNHFLIVSPFFFLDIAKMKMIMKIMILMIMNLFTSLSRNLKLPFFWSCFINVILI